MLQNECLQAKGLYIWRIGSIGPSPPNAPIPSRAGNPRPPASKLRRQPQAVQPLSFIVTPIIQSSTADSEKMRVARIRDSNPAVPCRTDQVVSRYEGLVAGAAWGTRIGAA